MSLHVAAAGDTDLVLTRAFAAPPDLVFDALTRPELLKRWHGARGWQLVVCEVDLRPGGAWRFVSRGPDGAEMTLSGEYREIVRPHRIVQTEVHDGWVDGIAVLTTELTGATTMTTTARYPSREVRDVIARSPMERGAGEAYDRLSLLLEEK